MYRHLALDFCLEDSIDAPRNTESFTTIVLRIPITATQYSGSRRRSLLAVTKSSAAVLHRPEPENKQLPSTVPSYLPTPRQTHFLLAHRQHDRAWFDTSLLLLPRIKALLLVRKHLQSLVCCLRMGCWAATDHNEAIAAETPPHCPTIPTDLTPCRTHNISQTPTNTRRAHSLAVPASQDHPLPYTVYRERSRCLAVRSRELIIHGDESSTGPLCPS